MEEEKKGFVIKDRRLFDETGEVRKQESAPEREEKDAKPAAKAREEDNKEDYFFPEASFTNLVLSLSTQAVVHFGDFPDPVSQQARKNLPAAKHTIDLLGMLKNKTEGNLDEEEKRLIDEVLFELRMRYVKETS
ncbi:MAG: DUF1844 domain-containing protein [Syntrophales bacterium]|nr:DUF1844 domain-containing protein [Syntrophales bacterium]